MNNFRENVNNFIYKIGARIEDFMHQKLKEGKKKERQTNYELLGQCMFDAGSDLGPGTAYGKIRLLAVIALDLFSIAM